MTVSLNDDCTWTERRDFHLDGVVLYSGRGINDRNAHYFALNAYENGVYMQNDHQLDGPRPWDGWRDYTADRADNTCSYIAVYVRGPSASSSSVAEEDRGKYAECFIL